MCLSIIRNTMVRMELLPIGLAANRPRFFESAAFSPSLHKKHGEKSIMVRFGDIMVLTCVLVRTSPWVGSRNLSDCITFLPFGLRYTTPRQVRERLSTASPLLPRARSKKLRRRPCRRSAEALRCLQRWGLPWVQPGNAPCRLKQPNVESLPKATTLVFLEVSQAILAL